MSSKRYAILPDDDPDDGFNKPNISRHSCRSRVFSGVAFASLCVTVAILVFLNASPIAALKLQSRKCPSFGPTDLPGIQHHIGASVERIFTGEIEYNSSTGAVYRAFSPGEPRFFGEPNPGIDVAWVELLRGTVLSAGIQTRDYTDRSNYARLAARVHC